jgi:hypothetical protein
MKTITAKVIALAIFLFAAGAIAQPIFPGGGGCTNCPPATNYFAPLPYIPGLKLAILPPSGTNLFINLLEADPAGTYGLFSESNLVAATWSNVIQGTNGQTNFTLPYPFTGMGFLRAARTDTPVTDTAGMMVSFPNNYANTNLISAIVTGGPAAAMAVLVNDTNLADAIWIPFSAVPFVLLGTNDGVYQIEFGFVGSDGQTNWTSGSVTLDTTPPLLVVTNPTVSTVDQPMIQIQGYSLEMLSSITFDVSNADGDVSGEQGFLTDQYFDANLSEFSTNSFQCFDVQLANGLNIITLHAADYAGNLTTTNFAITVDYSAKTNSPVFNLIWPQNGDQVSGDQFTFTGKLDDWTATVTASLVDINGATNSFNGLVERNGNVWIEGLCLNPGTNVVTINVVDAAGNNFTTNVTVINAPMALTITPLSGDQLNGVTVDNVSGTLNLSGYTVWVNGVEATQDGNGNWSATNVSIGTGGTAVIQARAIPNTDNGGYGSLSQSINPNSLNSITVQTQTNSPTIVYMANYDGSYSSTETINPWGNGIGNENHWESTHFVSQFATNGNNGGSGSYGYTENDVLYGNTITDTYVWPLDIGPVTKPMTVTYVGTNWWNNSELQTNVPVSGTYQASGNVLGIIGGSGIFGGMVPVMWSQPAEHSSRNETFSILNPDGSIGTATRVYTWDTTRKYTSEMRLRTGGKAIPQRQNLFAIQASATAYPNLDPAHDGLNSQAGYWFDFTPHWGTYNVTPTDIRVLGKQVGADGNLYTVLPDGIDISVMPVVAVPRYACSVSAQKHRLKIQVNGSTILSSLGVVRGAHYCVGQYLEFTPYWIPTLPSGTQKNPILWSFGGTFVNSYTSADGTYDFPNSSDNYYEDTSLLKNETTYAWWVSGGFNTPATYTATIGEGLTFANGQYVAVAANGKFTMFKPQILSHTTNSVGAVILDTNSLPTVKLRMNPYIQWTTHVGLNTNFSCNLFNFQLVNWEDGYGYGIDCSLSWYDGTGGNYWLDNGYPYGGDSVMPENPDGWGNYTTDGAINHGDGPDIEGNICSFIELNPSFKTYLCFQPTTPNSIPITLERGEWSEHGRADSVNGVWSLTYSYMVGPSFYNDDSFPIWKLIYYNGGGGD